MFVLLMAALLYAREPPSPRPSRALKEAAERLKAYYRETPSPDGLAVVAVDVRGGEVWVDVRAPARPGADLAGEIEARCPPASDVAWRLLADHQIIQVRAVTGSGQALVAVDCRVRTR